MPASAHWSWRLLPSWEGSLPVSVRPNRDLPAGRRRIAAISNFWRCRIPAFLVLLTYNCFNFFEKCFADQIQKLLCQGELHWYETGNWGILATVTRDGVAGGY